MSNRANVTYLYDGSFDGLLTAVFEAYARRERPVGVEELDGYQTALGGRSSLIITDEEKAARVQRGICAKMGLHAFHKLSAAFLSPDTAKSTAIYQYIRLGMRVGPSIHNHIAEDSVLAVETLGLRVEHEAHLFKGFVRFSQLEGGIFYSRIEPKGNVLPLIMPHFVERYNDQPFIIHDITRLIAGFYDLREWQLAEAGAPSLPPYAREEAAYRRMWNQFYNTIAIKERYNPLCRRGHMPKRYWSNLTEMTWLDTAPRNQQAAGESPAADISLERERIQTRVLLPTPRSE